MSSKTFSRLVQALLIYTFLVILWGAWVRISHSGDGCGESWPLCKGQLIPDAEHGKTWIEFTHRIMSGLFGIIVFSLYLKGRSLFLKGHLARKWGFFSLLFTITEALLGAKLVLFGLVGANGSFLRAFAMGLHFINSAMLTGSIYMWVASSALKQDSSEEFFKPHHLKQVTKSVFYFIAVAFAILGITGTLAALSTTLYPSSSLLQGIMSDLSPDSHWILRARLSHPVAGVLVGGSLAYISYLWTQLIPNPELQKRGRHLAVAFMMAIMIGVLTLGLLSPTPLKLIHLGMAHLLCILTLRLWTIKHQISSEDSTNL
jgi:heme a synthase